MGLPWFGFSLSCLLGYPKVLVKTARPVFLNKLSFKRKLKNSPKKIAKVLDKTYKNVIVSRHKIKGGKMTTELIQAFSIEVGEQIVLDNLVYRVVGSDYSEDSPGMWLFQVVDEEGLSRSVSTGVHQYINVLVE